MKEGRRGAHRREIVTGDQRGADVPDRHRRRHAVGDDRCPGQRIEHEDRDRQGDGDNRDGRRQDPPRSPRIEAQEVDGPRSLALAQEQAGDQEPGDDEEDIDADEPAGHTGEARVEQHDEHNGQAAHALDVRTETLGSCRVDDGRPPRAPASSAAEPRSAVRPTHGEERLRATLAASVRLGAIARVSRAIVPIVDPCEVSSLGLRPPLRRRPHGRWIGRRPPDDRRQGASIEQGRLRAEFAPAPDSRIAIRGTRFALVHRGAEEDWRRRMWRRMTAGEPARVLRRYPRDTQCGPPSWRPRT